jgi:hypothetical protein
MLSCKLLYYLLKHLAGGHQAVNEQQRRSRPSLGKMEEVRICRSRAHIGSLVRSSKAQATLRMPEIQGCIEPALEERGRENKRTPRCGRPLHVFERR